MRQRRDFPSPQIDFHFPKISVIDDSLSLSLFLVNSPSAKSRSYGLRLCGSNVAYIDGLSSSCTRYAVVPDALSYVFIWRYHRWLSWLKKKQAKAPTSAATRRVLLWVFLSFLQNLPDMSKDMSNKIVQNRNRHWRWSSFCLQCTKLTLQIHYCFCESVERSVAFHCLHVVKTNKL